jgi:hypothetical protein
MRKNAGELGQNLKVGFIFNVENIPVVLSGKEVERGESF